MTKKVRVQYYLRRWKMLEENVNDLKPCEMDKAKMLFNSLPKLNEDDLRLLKAKYYDTNKTCSFDKTRGVYTSCIPINDEVRAYHENVTIEQYGVNRRIAEGRLEDIMLEVGHELLNSKEKIYLKINRFLYIKQVEIQEDVFLKGHVEVSDIRLTGSIGINDKQVFDLSNDVVKQGVLKLEQYGFEREALTISELERLG